MKEILNTWFCLLMMAGSILITSCTKNEDNGQTDPSSQSGTVIDVDGNTYKTVVIGTQTWMAENLKVTKYRNGDLIPKVTGAWDKLTNGAFCWYNNDIINKDIYGALYNWYSIKDNRNIAPVGWHVATDSDWTKLTTYLGGENVAGGKLKEIGTNHWETPNTGATNQYGFNALPSGITYGGIMCDGLKVEGVWWSNVSTSPTTNSEDWNRQMWYDEVAVERSGYAFSFERGHSVRCVKD